MRNMPQRHAHTSRARSAKASRPPVNRRAAAGPSARSAPVTVERDDTYGLISVIYHALQGAETCAQYAADARRVKNPELVAFFQECQVEHNERALRARHFLAEALREFDAAELEDDDDEIEEQSSSSGPAGG